MKNKRGQVLIENVVFIILNLVFLAVLILFILSKSGSEAALEDKYSKQIALMIDSAKPRMEIHLNMQDAIKEANSNDYDVGKIVLVNAGEVKVNVGGKGEGKSSSFFNDVDVSAYPDKIDVSADGEIKNYIIRINGYN